MYRWDSLFLDTHAINVLGKICQNVPGCQLNIWFGSCPSLVDCQRSPQCLPSLSFSFYGASPFVEQTHKLLVRVALADDCSINTLQNVWDDADRWYSWWAIHQILSGCWCFPPYVHTLSTSGHQLLECCMLFLAHAIGACWVYNTLSGVRKSLPITRTNVGQDSFIFQM